MTLLNRASDGLASVLVTVVRTLREVGPMERDALIDLLTPGSLGDDAAKRVRETILRWEQLGLFVESGSELALSPDYTNIVHEYSDQPTMDELRRTTLELVLKEGADQDSDLVDDAIIGSWWLLTTDPFSDPIGSWDEAQRVLARDFPNTVLIQNDTRWAGLLEWAHLWGLIQLQTSGSPVIPCPAEAIGWHLSDLLQGTKPLPVKTFLMRLHQRLPIVPLLEDAPVDGPIGNKVPKQSRPFEEQGARLSVSLSLALNTLREMGRLQLKNFDTASKWYLTDIEGAPVTHLVRQ